MITTMITIKHAPIVLLLAAFLALASCAGTAPNTAAPTAPTPPQVSVAQAVNALAQAVDGTVTTAIAARDQGKVSQSDLNAIENVCKAIALWGKAANAELRSADDWPTQKARIAQSAAVSGIAALKGQISPTAQALITTLLIVANQITGAIGGPAL